MKEYGMVGKEALWTVQLPRLMALSSGRPEVVLGVIDGPIAVGLADFAPNAVQAIRGSSNCNDPAGSACQHGTFIASMLVARRGSLAPALCPDCTLVAFPLFHETADETGVPKATSDELADAIIRCLDAGARVLNLSLELGPCSVRAEKALQEALNDAMRRGAIVAAAAGNWPTLRGSKLTQHPAVIPVVASNERGWPLASVTLSASTGRQGLRAPGQNISSLGPDGNTLTWSGTSVATPFVSGTAALLWSLHPQAQVAEVRRALTCADSRRRTSVVPPLLNAWEAHQMLANEA